MIRAYLVDDEEHALNLLELFLNRIGGVEVVGRTTNPYEAIIACQTLRPDVAFLDIEMPEIHGVELAEIIKGQNMDTYIVFVTAHMQYAISAFEQAAIDYLLKPIELQRLTKTIQRISNDMFKNVHHDFLSKMHLTSEAPRLHAQCLGNFEVHNNRDDRIKWRTMKVKELFAFLLSRGQERVHRDVIIDTLWNEQDYQKAKIYLHTCISSIRNHFKQLGFDQVVLYENEKYYLNLSCIHSDLYQFRQSLEAIKQDNGEDLIQELERVLDLYQGPLLADCDYPWADIDRISVNKSMVDISLLLAEKLYEQGEYKRALEALNRLLKQYPYSEEAYRMQMSCYQQLGKHDEVFQSYHKLIEVMSELQVEPSAVTKALFKEITLMR